MIGTTARTTDDHSDNTLTGSRSSWFANLPVRSKLLLLTAVLALVAILTGALGISKLAAMDDKAEQLYQGGVVPMAAADGLLYGLTKMRNDLLNVGIAVEPGEKAEAVEQLTKSDKALTDQVAAYAAVSGGHSAKELESIKTNLATYRTLRETTLLPLLMKDDLAGFAEVRAAKARPLTEAIDDAITAIEEDVHTTAKQASEAAEATYKSGRTTIMLILLAGLALGVALAMYVTRMITRPIGKMSAALESLAKGDLRARVDYSSRDELGKMSGDLNTAVTNLSADVASIADNATSLAGTSEQLAAAAGQMSASAEETSTQASVVSAASNEVSANVQTVAAGAEQMGASIKEIATNASEASRVAASAVQVAATTTVTVANLGDSSDQISEVVKAITSIAQQTNLLALNATIEAARAGEAGKGFAVVANEVKELAQETAKATEDISQRITAIQAGTAGAVSAIEEISEVIGRISDYQNVIAAAVEEQTATTNEMSRSVAEAAGGSVQITDNIAGVAQAAALTSQGVIDAQTSVDQINVMAGDLRALVGKFRY